MNETSCFSPKPSPYRCHLFPWQQCFWWHCCYRSNVSIAWVPGGGRARLHQPVPFLYSTVFSRPPDRLGKLHLSAYCEGRGKVGICS